jgi:hypothetical protein
MDIIRDLLLRLESLPLGAGDVVTIPYDSETLAVEGRSAEEISYHIELIHEARLTEPYNNQGMLSLTFSGLTWKGNDFIDSVRDPKIWRETKNALHKAGGYTADIAIAIAKGILQQQLQRLGIPTG